MSRRYRLVMEEVRNEEKLPASTLALEDSRIVIKGDPEFDSITEQKYTIANDYIKECEISHSDGVELKYARDNSLVLVKTERI